MVLAAANKFIGRPFALFIDELEHLATFDRASQLNQGVLWLKRLLELLAPQAAVVCVAGHDSAWEDQPDSLQRYSKFQPLLLVKLTNEEVLALVQTFVGSASTTFGLPEATQVTEIARGNIRRILALCRLLYTNTAGFTNTLSPEDIRKAADTVRVRIPVDEAIATIAAHLEGLGLETRRQATLGPQLAFDLVGYIVGLPLIAVDFKGLAYDTLQSAEVRRFYERIKASRVEAPRLIGAFVLDGELEPGVLALAGLASETGLLALDLSENNLVAKIVGAVASEISARRPSAGSVAASGVQPVAAPQPGAPPTGPAGPAGPPCAGEAARRGAGGPSRAH